jgi:hypothetical protein
MKAFFGSWEDLREAWLQLAGVDSSDVVDRPDEVTPASVTFPGTPPALYFEGEAETALVQRAEDLLDTPDADGKIAYGPALSAVLGLLRALQGDGQNWAAYVWSAQSTFVHTPVDDGRDNARLREAVRLFGEIMDNVKRWPIH